MTIFDRRTNFMNWYVLLFVVCVHLLGSIIESIGHLSFCKKRDFYGGDSEENKWGMFFLFSFLWG